MLAAAQRRFLDVLGSVYLYNEYRGYRGLQRLLDAIRRRFPDETGFIAQIDKHQRDERKHYLMFRRYFEGRGVMPFAVDSTCGYVDQLIHRVFGCELDDLDTDAISRDREQLDQLCRVIMLTEMRGVRQVDMLLRSRIVTSDRRLTRIFRVVERDEPSHWEPYRAWLERTEGRLPDAREIRADRLVHRSLMHVKLPLLYLDPRLARRTDWYDEA